jgi:hypothetical protein
MAALEVTVEERRFGLAPGEVLTFGRDRGCTVCLDPSDQGISRIAGSVEHDQGVWWIVNRSAKRTLHVLDETKLGMPLPVARSGWPPSRRAVDRPELTVLVAGDVWTHAIQVSAPEASAAPGAGPLAGPTDPVSTVSQLPALTDNRREALVALARGYLRPYPHYDPRPLTYQAAADLLGLRRPQVVKRVEHVRLQLVEAGVLGLDDEGDARRALCEWLLAMRLITPADLAWLEERRTVQRTAAGPAHHDGHDA